MQSILITGAKGMLGRALLQTAGGAFAVTATDVEELDITLAESVKKYIGVVKPHAVINCAAYTDVDGSESRKETAYMINTLGPKHLAQECAEADVRLVHISTDYVFDGKKKTAYTEDDTPNPLSYYARTKRDGEKYVEQFCPDYVIVRTSGMFGQGGKNFVKTMTKLFETGGEVSVVADQTVRPTYSRDLAQALFKICVSDYTGILHAAGSEALSWHAFARMIRDVYRGLDSTGKEIVIKQVTSEQYKRPAKRPAFSVLDISRYESFFGPMPPLKDSLIAYMREICVTA